MTKNQSFALFCITKVDVRNCTITKEQASGFISRAKSGENIVNEVASLPGAVVKGEAKPKLDCQKIWDEAYAAGLKAGQDAIPTPMIVGTPTTTFGNDIDHTKKTYYVPDGCCGFAWIVCPGNNAFIKWCKANKDARSEYGGGTCVYWVFEFNQSMTRKEAFAYAFAGVLNKHGVKAYARSRMD